jgi:hypothetical protein
MSEKFPGVAMVSRDQELGAGLAIHNGSVAAQAVAAATLTYLTGSALVIPRSGLKVGTRLRWILTMTKTAAGTAASTFAIVFGTAGTVADTARVSFTKPAGTAAVDEATVVIEAIVRSVGAAGVVVGNFRLVHNLENTGHAVIPTVSVTTISAGFDNAGDDLIVGLVATTGAADAITIQLLTAEALGV